MSKTGKMQTCQRAFRADALKDLRGVSTLWGVFERPLVAKCVASSYPRNWSRTREAQGFQRSLGLN